MDAAGATPTQDREPDCPRNHVLLGHYPHGSGYANSRKGATQAPPRPSRSNVLDRAYAARTETRQFHRSVLGKEEMDLLLELWRFMRVRKKFWLLPILLAMLVLGGILVLAKGSAIAPFIYTLF